MTGVAVEHKLAEQRKFVLWWDGSGFNKRGPKLISDQKLIPPESTPDPVTLHRWRARLKSEAKYQQALEARSGSHSERRTAGEKNAP